MKIFMLILALFLSITAIAATAQTQPQPPAWQYKFVYQCDEKKANNLSAEGWELTDMSMAAYGSQGIATCVFRRTK